jgi:hypothetical protein
MILGMGAPANDEISGNLDESYLEVTPDLSKTGVADDPLKAETCQMMDEHIEGKTLWWMHVAGSRDRPGLG